MCADGPADILDFDDEEFIGAFSIHNRIMYRRRKTNNLLRAWIIFQEHVIKVLADSIVAVLEFLESWVANNSSTSLSSFVTILK
jgi:hypothetical protein